jgi:serine/threonine protein kinase
MILWEMATEEVPFSRVAAGAGFKVRQYIWEGKRPDIPTDLDPALTELIKQCLVENPQDRPRFDQIVNHPNVLLFPGAVESEYIDFCIDLVDQYGGK